MAKKPNLKGLIKADQVKTIGSGNYAQAYVPWSVIQALVNEHCPGWKLVIVRDPEGSMIWRVGNTGFVCVRYEHEDGTVDTEWTQSVMDNRHKSIPWDKIDSRAFTDTHRRALVACSAATFNLGIELWTRETLDDGYLDSSESAATQSQPASQSKPPMKEAGPNETTFREFCLEYGWQTTAIDELVKAVNSKMSGNWQQGIAQVKKQGKDVLNSKYAKPANTTSW